MNNHCEKSKITLDCIDSKIDGDNNLLICSASYEERCLSIPTKINPKNFNAVIVLKNSDVVGKGHVNARTIKGHFGSVARIVETTKTIAIHTADEIVKAIKQSPVDDATQVYVDVTTMTHETLLILFRLLIHIFPKKHKDIKYLYNPAAEYDPDTPYDKKWLSKGINDARSILGFSGKLLPSRKNHLTVLVGFEVNRASWLIDVFEPASLSLGYGDQSSFNESHREVNELKHTRLSDRYPNSDTFEFSPSDAFLVRDQILKEALGRPNMNLIVAPMNTKISTLGCALAAIEKPRIQLCYASAVTYNFDNYSRASEDCVIFKL